MIEEGITITDCEGVEIQDFDDDVPTRLRRKHHELRGEVACLETELAEERIATSRLRRRLDDSQQILIGVRDDLRAQQVEPALVKVENLIDDLDGIQ